MILLSHTFTFSNLLYNLVINRSLVPSHYGHLFHYVLIALPHLFVSSIFDCAVRGRRSSNAREDHQGGWVGDTEGMQKPRTVDEYVQAWSNQI